MSRARTRGKRSGVSGAFRELSDLQRKMLRIAGVDSEIAKMAAPKISAMAVSHFDSQQDWDGDPWRGTYTFKVPDPLLNRTGKLRAAVTHFEADDNRIVMGPGGQIPAYHVYQRPELWWPPKIPDSWDRLFKELLPQAVERVMEGG